MSDPRKPWEPDKRKLGNWAAMFDPKAHDTPPPTPSAPAAEVFDDADGPAIDASEYKPWYLQRGGGRGVMMLALRWFDVKAGLWHGAAMAYPYLYAVDMIGDRMVSLDFGTRQFVLEGHGLDVLAGYLLQGSVLKIIEYAAPVWPTRASGPIVTAIRRPNAE